MLFIQAFIVSGQVSEIPETNQFRDYSFECRPPITVDMFAIFSLRRPNILPVGKQLLLTWGGCPTHLSATGDLGVQRGLCRWYLSLHSDEHPITVSPEKKKTPAKSKSTKKGKRAVANRVDDDIEDQDGGNDVEAGGSGDPAGTVANIPPPLAPSVTKMLKTKALSQPPPALPDGLSVATLKSRLSGKKVK